MAHVHERYCMFDTAFGVCGIAWTDNGLSHVQLPERDTAATEGRLQRTGGERFDGALPPLADAGIAQLRQYFAGAQVDFRALPLDDQSMSDFNRRVYLALRDVEFGATTTYGSLAISVGSPGAARAVGMAMGRNPWPIVVPCHRVLAAAQKIGGFSAFGGGMTKQRLLRLEGIDLARAQMRLPGLEA